MSGNLDVLRDSGFSLDIAVFLAEASEAAYDTAEGTKAWGLAQGFSIVTPFNRDNVQGFLCSAENIALLAFRGTSNPGQWLRDARFFPAKHPWGRVHIGFKTGVEAVESDLQVFDEIASQADYVCVTGHSLGGALALIAAARLKMKGIKTSVYTYGQPRVGLGDFAERFSVEFPQRLWRFVNQSDIVTRVPAGLIYRHTGIVKRIVRPGVLEAMATLTVLESAEFALLRTDLADQFSLLKEVVAGGAALESASMTKEAQIDQPLLIDIDAPQLTELEFSELQLALGAATKSELEQTALEGAALPWFNDHSISEYIRLLNEIRG